MGCHYCEGGEAMRKFGVEICKLSVSTFYLFREQSHPGRAIVAYKDHVGGITELSADDRNAFFADIAKASAALRKAFNPDKINYGAYGDTLPHMHFHLVPKYRDGFEWGGVFAMNPGAVVLSDEECAAVVAKIKAVL